MLNFFTFIKQETIIVSEYMRALKLKSDGKKTEAIFLFNELLQAEALCQVLSVGNFYLIFRI